MKKSFIFGILFVLFLIFALLFFITQGVKFSPKSELEECKTIQYNGENKISLVFFSTSEQAKKYSNYLLTIPPFDENQEEFNIFYIDSYSPVCELYEGEAILCYSKELIRKASSCPSDYIVVISDNTKEKRSSSYMNVMSLNSNSTLNVLVHEFGHAFAFLSDEYVPATIPKNSLNCRDNCEKFQNLNEGCFQGCGKESYFRSIESGIMRTLFSKTLGNFDEQVILNKINPKISKLTGLSITAEENCQEQEYYLVEGNYENGKITIISKTRQPGCVGENGEGNFEYTLILTDNSAFSSEKFNPELIFTDNEEGGEVLENSGEFFLKIPIIENSKELQIKEESVKLASISLEETDSYPCKNEK